MGADSMRAGEGVYEALLRRLSETNDEWDDHIRDCLDSPCTTCDEMGERHTMIWVDIHGALK